MDSGMMREPRKTPKAYGSWIQGRYLTAVCIGRSGVNCQISVGAAEPLFFTRIWDEGGVKGVVHT